MFDMSYSEEQLALRKTARDFARAHIAPIAGRLDEEGEFPVELQFHITGSFEFFEDHFVHFRSGVDQGSSKNGE